ncbi:MAG: thioesterase family protein [Planctomycetota bacterium]
MAFEKRVKVRFADIDQAGIVYYPTILHYCHTVMEDFFEDVVGTPYPIVLKQKRFGLPTVRVEADYHAPVRYGDDLRIAMSVRRVGNASVTFQFEAFRPDGVLAARSILTKACVNMDTFRATPVPDFMRAEFAKIAAPAAAP